MINFDRCIKALEDISVSGNPSSANRQALIEEAIKLIQQDGGKKLDREYLGFKNYAAFGDQRMDCEYGMEPRHGYIVFSIDKTRGGRGKELGADHIYLLECIRDFGAFEDEFDLTKDYPYQKKIKNLCGLLYGIKSTREKLEYYENILSKSSVESMVSI